MEKTTTSARLRTIMQERGLKQADLVRICAPFAKEFGIVMGKSAISQYVTGKSLPAQRQLTALGEALNVSEAWLMGYDVPRERTFSGTNLKTNEEESVIPGLFPVRIKRFPVLGKIACGEPIFADEEHGAYVMASEDIHADYCLVAQGDSMSGACIGDGDIVFIRQMDVVPNGKIAAVLIGDEATLKYIDYRQETATLILTPANPAFRTQVYSGEELNSIRILGQAVLLHKSLE